MHLESHYCKICYNGIRAEALEPCIFLGVVIILLCILLCWDMGKWKEEFGKSCNFIVCIMSPIRICAYAQRDGLRPRACKKYPLISTQILISLIFTHNCRGIDRMWSASRGNKRSNLQVKNLSRFSLHRRAQTNHESTLWIQARATWGLTHLCVGEERQHTNNSTKNSVRRRVDSRNSECSRGKCRDAHSRSIFGWLFFWCFWLYVQSDVCHIPHFPRLVNLCMHQICAWCLVSEHIGNWSRTRRND